MVSSDLVDDFEKWFLEERRKRYEIVAFKDVFNRSIERKETRMREILGEAKDAPLERKRELLSEALNIQAEMEEITKNLYG